jgi:hypothetical protein
MLVAALAMSTVTLSAFVAESIAEAEPAALVSKIDADTHIIESEACGDYIDAEMASQKPTLVRWMDPFTRDL